MDQLSFASHLPSRVVGAPPATVHVSAIGSPGKPRFADTEAFTVRVAELSAQDSDVSEPIDARATMSKSLDIITPSGAPEIATSARDIWSALRVSVPMLARATISTSLLSIEVSPETSPQSE